MTAPEAVLRDVQVIVHRVAGPSRTPADAGPDTRLADGFWLDSMEMLEVVIACEQHFGIVFEEGRDLTPATLASVRHVVHTRLLEGSERPWE
jgi:acyl carrier protein